MAKHSRLVYSTDGGRFCPGCRRPVADCVCSRQGVATGDGVVRIQRQKQGRGGKEVTVITGLQRDSAQLKDLARAMKRRCGVGGAVKGGNIELQGDQREVAREVLEAEGFKVKLAGG